MPSPDAKNQHPFRAEASALSGSVREPLHKEIPLLAPVALPHSGGFATKRSGAFNLDEVVSCSSAYTLLTARRSASGAILALATAVIEDLNILQVATARRIVAQISVTIARDGAPRRISLAGSRFEGLRLAGHDSVPRLSLALHQPIGGASGPELPLTWHNFSQWAAAKYGRMMGSVPRSEAGEPVLCSLVEGFEGAHPSHASGHVVDIPGFGKIILGELQVSGDSLRLVSIRAELGCPVTGVVTGPTTDISGGGGTGGPD
ncbi:MAG TPA: hypothetical protein VME42_07505 [Steroidobacteraceae bacterium]|nr:hypothetical protein [Steroidobacteraceae bacterium]